jgi:two-component sensor histidine kinase
MLSQNALQHFDDPEFQKDALRTLSRTVDRMKALLARLSAAPDAGRMRSEPVDLSALLLEATRPLDGGRVSLVKEFAPVTAVPGDDEALLRVIQNLVTNAMEAVRGSGTVTVRSYEENGQVVCEVTDTGCGMSPEFIQKSLFAPFKSTKSGGWGIGLYQAKGIVLAHGGSIEVTSREGTGSTFRLRLPISAPPTGRPSLTTLVERPLSGFARRWRGSFSRGWPYSPLLSTDPVARLRMGQISEPSHGFAIPFIAGYLVWARRGRLSQLPFTPSAWGLPLLLVGLLALVVGVRGDEPFGGAGVTAHHIARADSAAGRRARVAGSLAGNCLSPLHDPAALGHREGHHLPLSPGRRRRHDISARLDGYSGASEWRIPPVAQCHPRGGRCLQQHSGNRRSAVARGSRTRPWRGGRSGCGLCSSASPFPSPSGPILSASRARRRRVLDRSLDASDELPHVQRHRELSIHVLAPAGLRLAAGSRHEAGVA